MFSASRLAFLGFICCAAAVAAPASGPLLKSEEDAVVYTYQKILGRPPENRSVIMSDVGFLKQRTTFNQLKRNFEYKACSTEFSRRLYAVPPPRAVDVIFQALLGRAADSSEHAKYDPVYRALGSDAVAQRIIWQDCREFDRKLPRLPKMRVDPSDPVGIPHPKAK
jgi:hypothetical protein